MVRSRRQRAFVIERPVGVPDEPTDAARYAEAWTTELMRRLAAIESGRARLLTVPEAMALIGGAANRAR